MSKRGGSLYRLIRKEMREILRDRRTIFTLILMPLLVYPMLNLVFQRYLLTSLALDEPERSVVRIAFQHPADLENLGGLIRFGVEQEQEIRARQKAAAERAGTDEGGSARKADAPDAPDAPLQAPATELADSLSDDDWLEGIQFEFQLAPDLAGALRRGDADLGVRLADPQDFYSVELMRADQSLAGRRALDIVTSAITARNYVINARQNRALQRQGLPTAEFVRVSEQQVAVEAGPNMLSSLVPLILIMMTVTGAVYPAIDLTAGERERATLETLLAAPISRVGLLLAKYTAVVTVAVLTAVVNLGGMAATIVSGGLGPLVFGEQGLTVSAVAAIFALLILFAAFFSAVLLMVTSSARSFKEAQAYLIPLMLVSLGPGLISLLPGVELTLLLALTPLINVVLLARDIFLGETLGVGAVVAVLATIAYTFLAISLAATVFGKDAVIQAQGSGRRRQPGAWDAPSPRFAVLMMLSLVPLYFFLGGWLARMQSVSLSGRLLMAAAVTGLLFGVLPWIACIWERVPVRLGLRLASPKAWQFVPALVLGIAAWPFAHELVLLGSRLGIYTLSSGQLERVREMLSVWREQAPLGLLLLCLAAAPAFFEELFFRGYLYRAWQRQLGPARAIVLTAVLFGLFHVISAHQLTPERFLPSTFLGLLLGAVAWRSGSIWPGVLLHFCNNGLLLAMAYYTDQLMEAGVGVDDATHLPATWLAAAGAGCIVSLAILLILPGKKEPPASPVPPGSGKP